MNARKTSLALSLLVAAATVQAERNPVIYLKFSDKLSTSMLEPAPVTTLAERQTQPGRKKKPATLTLTTSLSAWTGTRRLDDVNTLATPRLAGELLLPLPNSLQITVAGDLAREQTDTAEASRSTATLREAYLGYKRGPLSLRAGYQIINWGRTDVVNPTDNVSARDYTRLVDSDADQKLGVPSLNLIYRLDSTSIQAIWQPRFRGTAIPLPAVPGLSFDERKPDGRLNSGGLRIDTIGERLSWSVSYFHGPAKRPNLAFSLPEIAAGRITLDHPEVSTFGTDAEWIAGPWVIRSETAYNQFKGSGSDLIASRESFVESALGLERAFGQTSAFLQAGLRHTFDYLDPYAAPAPLLPLSVGNASVNEELYRTMFTIGGGLSLNTSDLRWASSLDFAYVPAHGDVVVRPRVRYRYNDAFSLWAGFDYFAGPKRGVFGRLEDNTVGFIGFSTSLALKR